VASAGLQVRSDDDFAKMLLLEALTVLERLSSEKNARRKGAALQIMNGASSSTIPAQNHAVAVLLSRLDGVSEKGRVMSSTVASAMTDLRSEK